MEGYVGFYDDDDDDDGDYGDVDDGIPDHTGIQGQKISVDWDFDSIEGKRYFCKGKCKDADRLIETVRDYSVKDRYSLRFTNRPGGRGGVMTVSITQLTKADSGLYGCGLDVFGLDPFHRFRITVTDAPPTFNPSPELTPSYQSSTSATESTTEFDRESTETTKNEPSGVLWHVMCVVVAALLLLQVLLFICGERASRPEGFSESPEGLECGFVTEAGRVAVREEDWPSGSPPLEILTCVRYTGDRANSSTASRRMMVI